MKKPSWDGKCCRIGGMEPEEAVKIMDFRARRYATKTWEHRKTPERCCWKILKPGEMVRGTEAGVVYHFPPQNSSPFLHGATEVGTAIPGPVFRQDDLFVRKWGTSLQPSPGRPW